MQGCISRTRRREEIINYLLLLEDIREKSWAGRRHFINEYSRIAISNYERMTMYLVKRRYIIHLYCYFFWLIILQFGGNAQCITRNRWLHHTSFLHDFKDSSMDYLLLPSSAPGYRDKRSHLEFLCRLNERYPRCFFYLVFSTTAEICKPECLSCSHYGCRLCYFQRKE